MDDELDMDCCTSDCLHCARGHVSEAPIVLTTENVGVISIEDWKRFMVESFVSKLLMLSMVFHVWIKDLQLTVEEPWWRSAPCHSIEGLNIRIFGDVFQLEGHHQYMVHSSLSQSPSRLKTCLQVQLGHSRAHARFERCGTYSWDCLLSVLEDSIDIVVNCPKGRLKTPRNRLLIYFCQVRHDVRWRKVIFRAESPLWRSRGWRYCHVVPYIKST